MVTHAHHMNVIIQASMDSVKAVFKVAVHLEMGSLEICLSKISLLALVMVSSNHIVQAVLLSPPEQPSLLLEF